MTACLRGSQSLDWLRYPYSDHGSVATWIEWNQGYSPVEARHGCPLHYAATAFGDNRAGGWDSGDRVPSLCVAFCGLQSAQARRARYCVGPRRMGGGVQLQHVRVFFVGEGHRIVPGRRPRTAVKFMLGPLGSDSMDFRGPRSSRGALINCLLKYSAFQASLVESCAWGVSVFER